MRRILNLASQIVVRDAATLSLSLPPSLPPSLLPSSLPAPPLSLSLLGETGLYENRMTEDWKFP